ncbi:transcriptional regulator, GntR family [Carnobacterium iners]|uniref:Transcriptional regulator, GntR family n=1 Tax=Carnobacterium iners TaxID=1073423 RepID=A0A1X7N4D4_9LACT|nr:GntR family transcriptional regulator [Carnobacterium iners]SEL37710.1 transcriptional regulator, GntR family [Carnobacterium iners]SMH31593.1 transcriptional regulator, GntR family [Carnobacterium iners]
MVKYEAIANEMRQRILTGTYPIESLIPDQISLAKEFRVSRMTMKKALDILAMEGLIYRQRGSGTFVMKTALLNQQDSAVNEYEGLTKQLSGKKVTSKVIEFNVEFPSEEIMKHLMIKKKQPVYKLVRLRVVDGNPYVLEHTYMPVDLAVGLTEEILEQSIYRYIHEELDLHFGGAFRKIHADKSSHYDQEYLNCKIDDPILEVEQVVYLKDGRPFEYSRSRHRYDTRSYTISDINRNN